MRLTMNTNKVLVHRSEEREARKFILTLHAQARKEQRFLSFSEIESALKYGVKHPADGGAWEYRFGGVIAVVDRTESIVLTVYPEPGFGIELDKLPVTDEMVTEHKRSCRRLRSKTVWTSHTVAVIDHSGSMRTTDVDKNVSRSDSVWLALANDVVRSNIESGERKATDVLSVILMQEDATVLINQKPFDWILYNDLIDIMKSRKPSSGGNYGPALDMAEALLMTRNRTDKCALALLFLSDGKPSDHIKRGKDLNPYQSPKERWATCMKQQIGKRIEDLASLFGKRLNLCFYAIGAPGTEQDFGILKYLADQSKAYECPVVYQPPSLKLEALSTALRSMSLTTSTTRSTFSSHAENLVLRNKTKMKQTDVGSPVATETWDVILQGRDRAGMRIIKMRWVSKEGWKKSSGALSHPDAIGLAMEKRWFGEGKERLAKELREVGRDGKTFVGPPMVLKASIVVSNNESIDVDSKEFHKRFCKAQKKADYFANRFNEMAQKIASEYGVEIPMIKFLKCWVYMIKAPGTKKGKFYLVEPAINVLEYKKFNNNDGKVYQQSALPHRSKRGGASQNSARDTFSCTPIIEEEEEFDEEGNDTELPEVNDFPTNSEKLQDEDYDPEDSSTGESGIKAADSVKASGNYFLEEDLASSDVLQAFSCFTHKVSERAYLVCDLQGTLVEMEDGSRVYLLTDPAIHTSRERLDKIQQEYGNASLERFGRTDCGQEGIDKFFQTHNCSKLCRLVSGRRLRGHRNFESYLKVGRITDQPLLDLPVGE